MNCKTEPRCDGCRFKDLPESGDAWCYMFLNAPEELPCGQHDKFKKEVEAMGKLILKNPAILMGLVEEAKLREEGMDLVQECIAKADEAVIETLNNLLVFVDDDVESAAKKGDLLRRASGRDGLSTTYEWRGIPIVENIYEHGNFKIRAVHIDPFRRAVEAIGEVTRSLNERQVKHGN